MATVICSACGKENEPTASWNYCRSCGGRLTPPVAQTTLLSAERDSEAVTATATRPATAKRLPVAKSAPARKSTTPPKTKQELAKELMPWTFGLIIVFGTIGMIIGSVLKKSGEQYGLLDDPFNLGMIGGIVTGGLLAQCMLWYRQSQQ